MLFLNVLTLSHTLFNLHLQWTIGCSQEAYETLMLKYSKLMKTVKKNYNNYVKSPPEDFCHLDQPRPSDLKSHMVHLSSSLRCFKITMFKKENTVTIIPYWGFHLLVMKAAYTGNMLFIAKCLQKHSVRPFLLSCHLKHKCKHGGTKSFAGFFFSLVQNARVQDTGVTEAAVLCLVLNYSVEFQSAS